MGKMLLVVLADVPRQNIYCDQARHQSPWQFFLAVLGHCDGHIKSGLDVLYATHVVPHSVVQSCSLSDLSLLQPQMISSVTGVILG